MKKKKHSRLKRFLEFVEKNKYSKNIKVDYESKAYSYCANSTDEFRIERMNVLLKNKEKKVYQYFFFNRFIDKKKGWCRYKFFGYKKIYKNIDEFLQKHAIQYTHKREKVWHEFVIGKDPYNPNSLMISINNEDRRSGELINMSEIKKKLHSEKKFKKSGIKKRVEKYKKSWNIFSEVFEKELDMKYISRPKRYRRDDSGNMICYQSDKVRIKDIFNIFKDKEKRFEKYCRYIINDVWGEAPNKMRRMDNLIGFMENDKNINNFKILVKMKSKSKIGTIAGKKYSGKIDKRWEND